MSCSRFGLVSLCLDILNYRPPARGGNLLVRRLVFIQNSHPIDDRYLVEGLTFFDFCGLSGEYF